MTTLSELLARPLVPRNQGKAPYLWVLLLSFLLWKYVYVRPGVLELACLAVTTLVFLPVYFASFRASGAASLLCVLASCLLGALWAPHNFGANTFFIFAAAMCAGIRSPRQAYLALALVLGLALLVTLVALDAPLSFAVPALAVGLPVGVAAIMDANLRRSREQLLRKQEEVEHMATIAERERISRDLHDLLGHSLSLITLKAELAGKLLARDAAACRQEIADIEQCARTALAEVRAAVTGYRQTGFAHELATAHASLAAAGVALAATVQPIVLPPALESVMALALREAVTNIVRHARASRCELSVSAAGAIVVLRIADNGRTLAETGRIDQGNGLTGMRERVAALGGTLDLRLAKGLTIELSLPMGARA